MLKLLLIGLTLVHTLTEQFDDKPSVIAECHNRPLQPEGSFG